MKVQVAFFSTMLLATVAGRGVAQVPAPTPDCEAIRCQVQDSLASCLANATNHGKCVSCVAHTVKALGIPTRCRGKVTRCVARSTCGKPNFETCTKVTTGTCDTVAGTCTTGTLAAGLTACTTDADCIVSSKCRVMRSFLPHETPVPGGDRCTLAGGTPGTGSCCAPCPTPVPVP